MKYVKKKKKSPLLGLLIGLTALLVVLVLVLILLVTGKSGFGGEAAGPSDQGDGTNPTGSQAMEETGLFNPIQTEPPVEDLRIETPYAVLVYPGEWSGLIQVDQISGDPHQVVFTAKLDSGIQQELFTISFGGGMENAIGVVLVDSQEVPVHLSVREIEPGANWTDNEISVIYAMQECLNYVLSGLELTTPQEAPDTNQTTLPPEDDKAMTIDTPAGEMHYPARWKDFLKLEIRQEDAYTLEFYTVLEGFEPVHLFDIHLGGDQGIYVMDLTTPDGTLVKLYVDIYEIEANVNWTDAQRAIVFAMQEDMNYLLMELNP